MTTTSPSDESTESEAPSGVPFTMDGQEILAKDGELLIDACERNGVHIPRFCYHPRMKPVGMCRMCLVEVDTGRGPSLQPSCMIPVTPGMSVQTETQPTKRAQDGVLELLLINHPLDCPVCDKGGECPLQDNAYAFGPGESRFVEEKRHFEKPIPLSDLVDIDRERCILCDRCTRFCSDVSGDPLISFIDRGSQTQVNTFPDHPFSSYFSGNTVQICPVGALLARPYRFKARPWDLDETESTAVVDSTGARVVLQSSRDRLIRVQGVDSDAVNWSWLSDKERFTYQAVDSDERLREPLVRAGDQLAPRRWSDAVEQVADALRRAPADRVGVIGGSRLSLEAQYAWSHLAKCVIGTDNVDAQLGDGLPPELVLGLPRATIAEACQPGGVVVLLAADPKEELATFFLRLRHAVIDDGVTLIEVTPSPTSLTELAQVRLRPRPGTVGALGRALAGAGSAASGVDAAELERAVELLGSGRPVTVIVGRANLAESGDYTAEAAVALHEAFPEARFLSALRRGAVHGALEMGLAPGLLPGRVALADAAGWRPEGWDRVPEAPGLDTEGMLRAAAEGRLDAVILLGADPVADFPDRHLARSALEAVPLVVAVDLFLTDSSSRADVVLPATGWGETAGSFVNLEGRVSPLRQKVTPPGQARPDWMIAVDLALALGGDPGYVSVEQIRDRIAGTVPGFIGLDWSAVERDPDGPLLTGDRPAGAPPAVGVPSVTPIDPPAVDGYGLRLVVDRKLWDLGTAVQRSSSLADLADAATLQVAPSELERLGVSSGDEVVIESDRGDRPVTVESRAGLPRGVARMAFRLPGFDAGDLIDTSRSATDIRVTTR
jgi:NADH-quinone oxidoreductase subunit G